MSEFTPGPWRINHDDVVSDRHTRAGLVAAVYAGGQRAQPGCYAEMQANQKLILAAPDLLAACQQFVAWDEDPHSSEADAADLRRVVAAAVAKATGAAS